MSGRLFFFLALRAFPKVCVHRAGEASSGVALKAVVVAAAGDLTRPSSSVCQLLGRRSCAASMGGALNCRRLGFAVADLEVVAAAVAAFLDAGGDGALARVPPVTPLDLARSVWCRCWRCCCSCCGCVCGRLLVSRAASLLSRRSEVGSAAVLGGSRAGSHQPPTPLRQVGRRAWL